MFISLVPDPWWGFGYSKELGLGLGFWFRGENKQKPRIFLAQSARAAEG